MLEGVRGKVQAGQISARAPLGSALVGAASLGGKRPQVLSPSPPPPPGGAKLSPALFPNRLALGLPGIP